jgi:hypothetical protein
MTRRLHRAIHSEKRIDLELYFNKVYRNEFGGTYQFADFRLIIIAQAVVRQVSLRIGVSSRLLPHQSSGQVQLFL